MVNFWHFKVSLILVCNLNFRGSWIISDGGSAIAKSVSVSELMLLSLVERV